MPIIAVAPNNELMEKLRSNLEEVRARNGQLYVFADRAFNIQSEEGIRVIEMPLCLLKWRRLSSRYYCSYWCIMLLFCGGRTLISLEI